MYIYQLATKKTMRPRQIFRQGSTMFIQREVVVHVDITEGLFEEVLGINVVKLPSGNLT